MRYPAAEKAAIIQLVEQSHMPAKRTLDIRGIPRATIYRWYHRYLADGPEALADRCSRPDRSWNRIPDGIRSEVIDLALEVPELSPRELAVRFTDDEKYFVSETSVYRLLKAHNLITSPAYVVIKAADSFKDKTTAINQLWQTDFTYLKIMGWGWYYLSTVLDDFSRYIVTWKRCATPPAPHRPPPLKPPSVANPTARTNLRADKSCGQGQAISSSRTTWSATRAPRCATGLRSPERNYATSRPIVRTSTQSRTPSQS